ncbi:aldehyde dehydrogenase, dimeric NADP-preferring-like [Penaeus monodon]|uniref:aldehyde dehydrogenase, dimeric NADP-preferring-like n=1 Tax=Penaeus monodon TaxID=6687 RepID=UPI0018A7CB61|nr:aldehyde dehydrogenase, dimeric NADP-preferring-like [Penaeus monodon]
MERHGHSRSVIVLLSSSLTKSFQAAMASFKEIVDRARAAFQSGRTRSVEFRKQQLLQLKKMYEENRQTFLDAVHSDLRKPKLEATLFETGFAEKDLDFLLTRVDDCLKPQEVAPVMPQDKCLIYKDPYGVVLVMGAWNYPLQLSLIPAAGAIAAGNAVIIKPSEVAPATAAAIAKLVPQYLDKECFHVVCGGVAETTELLKQRFDYIFYTGSTGVGKIVRDAANKFLTPTTLELGGKCPCYVDQTADLDIATRRILWGKLFNLGQTCIAPDYIMCPKAVEGEIVAKAKEILKEWYGDSLEKNPDLCRIVAERHVDRLAGYLSSGRVAVGGKYDRKSKWVEPTILVGVKEDSKVMQDEVFGPILPILNYENYQDAINFINKGEKPLAMYVFSKQQNVADAFLSQVSSGGATINDTLHHAANPNLPFGGVGHSGMGAYHGDYTIDTFLHKKSVLIRNFDSAPEKMLAVRYPPYTDEKLKILSA